MGLKNAIYRGSTSIDGIVLYAIAAKMAWGCCRLRKHMPEGCHKLSASGIICVRELIKKEKLLAKAMEELKERAQEYAQVYVLARQRQKGCDGMGDLDQFEAKGVQ